MFCGIYVVLCALGARFLFAKRVPIGNYEIRQPRTVYIGLILMLNLPIGMMSGFALGAAEGFNAAVAKKTLDAKKIQKKYAFLDWLIPGSAVAAAGLLGLVSLRREEEPEPEIEEEVVGVRDFMKEHAERERAATEQTPRDLYDVELTTHRDASARRTFL